MRTLLLAVVALVALGCAEKKPTTATAEKRDIVGYLSLQGELVVPQTARADIYPPYLAPVEKVMTTVGDNVREGQVLVQLSFPDAEAALKQARLTVQAAEAAYAQAETQYNGSVTAAQRTLDAARTEEKRIRALATEGVDTDLETATQARIAAEEAVADAKAQLKLQLLPYSQQLQSAREDLREAQSGAKLASIRAPISGTVVALDVQPGQQIGQDAKKVIITIIDLEALEIQSPVPAENQADVKKGTEVMLQFKEVPNEEFDAEVEKLTTLPSEDGKGVTYKAIIDFDNSKGLVKPGVTLTMCGVKMGEVKDVLAVPVESVDRDSTGKPIVKVLKGSEWLPTVVETGLTDGKYIQIKSGIEAGATVQVTPD